MGLALNNTVSIVTGGTGGMGIAISELFAKEGSAVIIVDLDDSKADDLICKIKKNGGEAVFYKADTTEKDKVKEVVAQTIKNYGKIDCLLNVAGIFKSAPIEAYLDEDWDKVIGTNLTGTYIWSKYVGAEMIKSQKGAIINIASLAALQPQMPLGAYSISKAGIIALTKLVAVEWAKYHIRVNSISPGAIATPLTNDIYKDPALLKARIDAVPLKRFGLPEEIAKLALFLASEDSSYITGENIVIDGGSQNSVYYLVNSIMKNI